MSKWQVIHGDCLEVLRTLPAGSVDAVVTDPPYGVGFAVWDSSIPDWLGLARQTASTVMFTTAPTTMWSYPRADWVGCWYRPASSSRAPSGGFNHWSPVLVYGPHRWPVDVVNLHAIAHAYPHGFAHPSPKPEAMMRWMLSAIPEGCTILDPFCGSGTTGVACMQTGRNFIGIEIDAGYCEIARRRIAEAANHLFAGDTNATT
jgi:DNA modification methylase